MKQAIYLLILSFFAALPSASAAAGNGHGEAGLVLQSGRNYIKGAYGEAALRGSYEWRGLEAALTLGLRGTKAQNNAFFSGLTAEVAYTVPIPHFPFEFRLVYNFSPHFESTIMEHDLVLMGSYQGRHLATGLGYQVRFNRSLDGLTKYVEYSNYLYLFEIYIWPQGHKYNIYGGVKNYDILNYGLDPLFYLATYYTLPGGGPRLFLAWLYQGAGVGPILFNHFDWKVRVALLWQF